jgi:murein DD-endopeptidase MepM/ murein hydrolase activator NlpD
MAIICVCLVGMVWVSAHGKTSPQTSLSSASVPTAAASPYPGTLSVADLAHAQLDGGITRLAEIHTTLLDRPRYDVIEYTVQPGDTIFDIAKKYGVKPSTILWGNLNKLADNPEMIYPGQVLNILPVDGVYYQWHVGDGLNGVAKGLAVTPEAIINYPGNHLDPQTIGDYSNPNIPVGTWLIVPGGYRNFITWSAPTISRFNPGVAHLFGPGACAKPMDGAVGTGTFTWPTVDHWLSGYDYTPDANHPAVDFAGSMGNGIYAADNGVIVYAGWNNWGYGNVTVIDHGNGYQTLYAHQSEIRVSCGQSVFKGQLIGNMGSTGNSSGPHLHFEMWYNGTHVNPHLYLPILSAP